MAKKRVTLPKDFEAQLKQGDIQALIGIFDKCEIEARGGYAKQTAIAFNDCPFELAKWLIEHGASIETLDNYHYTPLQSRAGSRLGNIKSLIELGADIHFSNKNGTALHCAAKNHVVDNVKILLEHGAEIDPLMTYAYGESRGEYTPLELTLFNCDNINIENALDISKRLLQAGAKKTERLKKLVTVIGTRFEFYRPSFNPEHVDETSSALDELYAIFDTIPVAKRSIHDGKAPIKVSAENWKKQHAELWDLLVPASGPAQTMQGEVIRISGRLARELKDNNAINWDEDFKIMTDSFEAFVKEGNALIPEELNELSKIVSEVKRKRDERIYRLTELGVKWVINNPTPISLPPVAYDR